MLDPQIHYCTSADGVRLAYAVIGRGSPIVYGAHWMTHLGLDLKKPVRSSLILSLAQRHTVVLYDPRGNGLSQRDVPEVSFELWVGDLEAVVDAVALDRFALLGFSQSVAISIQYAVRHPERVSHLILYGGYASGLMHRRDDPERNKQFLEISRAMIRQGWGGDHDAYRQWFTSQFIPDATAEQFHEFNDIQRASATPKMAEKYVIALSDIDVSDLLAHVECPALILHCVDDVRVPFAASQELAAGIPGAKLVPLEGRNHVPLPNSPALRGILEAIASFLGDPPIKEISARSTTSAERIDVAVKKIEQNWLMKMIVILSAAAGIFLFLEEIWRMLRH